MSMCYGGRPVNTEKFLSASHPGQSWVVWICN